MANDFDRLPLYDNLLKPGTLQMSPVWVDSFATFLQNLQAYLTSNGVLLPQITTAQRNAIQSPVPGQIIYNTTLGTAQYFKVNAWVSI